MNYKFLFVLLVVSPALWASEEMSPPDIATTLPPALTIDNWIPEGHKPTEPAAEAAITPPAPVLPVAVAAPATSSQSTRLAGMNEMIGILTAMDADNRTLRLRLEGGYLPQFAYDSKTTVLSQGYPLKVRDLADGDRIIVRYVGKEMTASEIEKLVPVSVASNDNAKTLH